jgi:hypothetical protein
MQLQLRGKNIFLIFFFYYARVPLVVRLPQYDKPRTRGFNSTVWPSFVYL